MEKMDLVERVARAIDAATWTNFDNYAGLKGWTEEERNAEMLASRSIQKSLGNARAAIEAMKPPTEAMIEAGVAADHGSTLGERVTNCHEAMISAALTPPP
jgi:hypothetical protein